MIKEGLFSIIEMFFPSLILPFYNLFKFHDFVSFISFYALKCFHETRDYVNMFIEIFEKQL